MMRRGNGGVARCFSFRCRCGSATPYFLHVLIITGIFTIAAMSLNLLLGYTGQSASATSLSSASAPIVSALMSLGFASICRPEC